MNTNISQQQKPKPPPNLLYWFYWVFYLLLIIPTVFWMTHKPISPKTQVIFSFFNRDVPAYHIIVSEDLYLKRIDAGNLTSDIVTNAHDLIGHYTLVPISADQIIHKNQIGPKSDPGLISNTFSVAISANNAMILGGNLRAGDIVSLASVPLSNIASVPIVVFSTVLVLDVKSGENDTVIVLAIPVNHWLDYLAKTRNATIMLARKVE